jgi:hypothetical protein
MVYRGIVYELLEATDVHRCWRWTFLMNNRRHSGQTKIGRRAAEIQARHAIDRGLSLVLSRRLRGELPSVRYHREVNRG